MLDRNDAAEQLVKLVDAKASPDEYMCLALNFILGALYDIREQNEKIVKLLDSIDDSLTKANKKSWGE